jgi:hypothetical protein
MAAPPVRYRVALDLTPEEYAEASLIVQRIRRSRINPYGQAFDLAAVLHLALASGLYELASALEALLEPSLPSGNDEDEPTRPR